MEGDARSTTHRYNNPSTRSEANSAFVDINYRRHAFIRMSRASGRIFSGRHPNTRDPQTFELDYDHL